MSRKQWEEIAQLQKPPWGSLVHRVLKECLQHRQLWAGSFPTQSHQKMVCPQPVLSPQTAFALSRLKEDEAAGANQLKINAINKESKKEKQNPSPAEDETFSNAFCCVETDCTVVVALLGFGRFRDIKYRWCLNFQFIKNACSWHVQLYASKRIYLCFPINCIRLQIRPDVFRIREG